MFTFPSPGRTDTRDGPDGRTDGRNLLLGRGESTLCRVMEDTRGRAVGFVKGDEPWTA